MHANIDIHEHRMLILRYHDQHTSVYGACQRQRFCAFAPAAVCGYGDAAQRQKYGAARHGAILCWRRVMFYGSKRCLFRRLAVAKYGLRAVPASHIMVGLCRGRGGGFGSGTGV
ncbi:hypothetical protein NPIL_683471 [Nephila pilipes]|uniref:Uncharacterized protein n=1 Tax=Nephila pilipes TaxID=299642 RepID=A0A8X6NF16_NEPPI|nr:hypothetical protein NPIL_683471 [Nephila pilipes]